MNMMDSGSWFIIWAMWRRTSFLVMMPRRRLNTKGTRSEEEKTFLVMMPLL